MAEVRAFRFEAVEPDGRRAQGLLEAIDEAAAFEMLRARGLTPLGLKLVGDRRKPDTFRAPSDRDSAEFLASLADLLSAGSDIRAALGILGVRADRSPVRHVVKVLNDDISNGEALERAFGRAFQGRNAFVSSMIAAGEASGDLPGGLRRAADVLSSRLKLLDQLVSVLAYPSFVLVSAVVAVFVILLVIVPTIAPLAEEAGGAPPASLAALMSVSEFLRGNLAWMALGAVAVVIGVAVAARLGMLSSTLEALTLDGPVKRTVRGVVFGGFAISLGTMLAAGAPVTEALKLAQRSVGNAGAQRRLTPLGQIVRQGQSLSTALDTVAGFPPSIVRLAAVGEATNALGEMLMRGGKLEEEAALRRIEAFGRLAGPALIVLLGGLLGVLMGGLLSGVSQMGQEALG